MRIPVVDSSHQPLMPTTPARARKWIRSGKAIKCWSDCGQFYVQLTIEPSGRNTQDIVIGLDPGKNFSGIGAISAKFTLYTAHLILPFKTVRERMDNRRLMRRGRRGRKINRKVEFSKRAHRQKRFNNRRQGKLAPSIRANRQLELRIVSELCKIYPAAEIRYEYVRADVDRTSGRKGAKSGKGFSPVMVGQVWLLEQLGKIAPVVKIEGYQTAQIRNHLGLFKNKANKSRVPKSLDKAGHPYTTQINSSATPTTQKGCPALSGSSLGAEFNSHAVDGVAIAASHFVKYRKYHKVDLDGANWFGSISITPAPFFVIRRPPYSRRQLHLMVPAIGGIRRKYGGSITRQKQFAAFRGESRLFAM